MKHKFCCAVMAGSLVAIAATAGVGFAQGSPAKKQPAPAPVIETKTDDLSLVRLPKANDAPLPSWVDEKSLKQTGDSVTFRTLGVMERNVTQDGKTAAAMWMDVSANCTTGAATPMSGTVVGPANQFILRVPVPNSPATKPNPRSTLALAVAYACKQTLPDNSLRALTFEEAMIWSRDEQTWKAALATQTAKDQFSKHVATPLPPAGTKFYDVALEGEKWWEHFRIYQQRLEPDAPPKRWMFEVLRTEKTVVGFKEPAAGFWSHWQADCANKKILMTDIVWVNRTGEAIASLPGLESKSGPQAGWSAPDSPYTERIRDEFCPAAPVTDLDLYLSFQDSINSELIARPLTSAGDMIKASRAALPLPPVKRELAMTCYGLVDVSRDVAGATQMDNWSYIGVIGYLDSMESLLFDMLAPSQPAREDRKAARAEWQPLVDRAKASKSGAEAARELEYCLASLPFNVEPGLFTSVWKAVP
jgi:hypothetical protein